MSADQKMSRVSVIKTEFPDIKFSDMKGMSEMDKTQLASAIARNNKIDTGLLDFEMVDY